MKQIFADLHNALFFIHDKYNKDIDIPPISGSEKLPIKSKDCIVVFAQHAIDGSVSIVIDNFISKPARLVEVFNDAINIHSGVLTLTDPEGEELLDFTVPEKLTSISIWVDDEEYPAVVQILLMV